MLSFFNYLSLNLNLRLLFLFANIEGKISFCRGNYLEKGLCQESRPEPIYIDHLKDLTPHIPLRNVPLFVTLFLNETGKVAIRIKNGELAI
jgi:hypothetical protein